MKLEATLFAARDLPKPNPRARQIPYCVLKIDGMEGEVQTQPVKSSRAPEWNETFELEGISAEELDLTITVMHKDRAISSVSFSLSDIAAGQEIDQWIELQTEDESQSGGEIHIRLAFSEEEAPAEEPTTEEQAPEEEQEPEEQKTTSDEPEEENTSGAPLSPKSKLARLERKIMTSELTEQEKNESVDNKKRIQQIKDDAAAESRQQYMAFLKEKTPMLLENEKRVAKYRSEQEGSKANE